MHNNNKPYFSIVTVTLNNLSGLQTTHASLAQQDHALFEWIVIDGKSGDGTPDWLGDMEPVGRSSLFISEPDEGLYDAMNKGLARADGQYVLFLNAGDVLYSAERLTGLEKFITQHKHPDFIYGDSYEQDPLSPKKLRYKGAKPVRNIHQGMITHHQAMLYKSDIAATQTYNLEYRLAGDYDFTVRFLAQAKSHQHYSEPICIFEAGGLSQKHAAHARREEFIIRKKHAVSGLIPNSMTYIRQSFTLLLQRRFPGIYYWLRATMS